MNGRIITTYLDEIWRKCRTCSGTHMLFALFFYTVQTESRAKANNIQHNNEPLNRRHILH